MNPIKRAFYIGSAAALTAGIGIGLWIGFFIGLWVAKFGS